MNTIKYALIILVLAACGNEGSKETVKTPQERAALLRDSAVRIAAKNADNESIQRSLALLDEAMDLDPNNKTIYNAKMNIYSKSKNYDGLIEVLEKMNTTDLKDPYSILQLGMEYELSGKKDLAIQKYKESADAFMTVLDTMRVDHRLKRNTVIMNVALASALSESSAQRQKLNDLMSDAEHDNLKDAMAQLDNLSREELLSRRRKVNS